MAKLILENGATIQIPEGVDVTVKNGKEVKPIDFEV